MSGPMIKAYSHLVWLGLMSWVQALGVGAVMLVTTDSYYWEPGGAGHAIVEPTLSSAGGPFTV